MNLPQESGSSATEFSTHSSRPKPPEQVWTAWQFVLLSLLSGGIFLFWWQYKMWNFLRERHGMQVMPLGRAVVNSIFPIFVLPLFINLAGRAQQRGYPLDFSPFLFSFAYLALYFVNLMLPSMAFVVLFLFIPCLPLLRVHQFLALTDSIPLTHARLFHKTDLAVVVIALVVNLLAAVWFANGGAELLGTMGMG